VKITVRPCGFTLGHDRKPECLFCPTKARYRSPSDLFTDSSYGNRCESFESEPWHVSLYRTLYIGHSQAPVALPKVTLKALLRMAAQYYYVPGTLSYTSIRDLFYRRTTERNTQPRIKVGATEASSGGRYRPALLTKAGAPSSKFWP